MQFSLICQKYKTLLLKKNDNKIILSTLLKIFPSRIVAVKNFTDFIIYKSCFNRFYINFYNPKNQQLLLFKYWKNLLVKKQFTTIKKVFKLNNFYNYKNTLVNLNHITLINSKFLKNSGVIDLRAKSIGKGFAGKIKRYHLQRGPMSHGSKHHRRLGSVGSGINRILKNKRMPGQLGNNYITLKNLKIIGLDKLKNYIFIKGSVPGHSNSFLRVDIKN